jgi:hypothetical protein
MTVYRPTSRDSLYTEAFIDADEWRDEPVRHRYMHGGFVGTEARFSFYFPPPDQYEGRFFQPIFAVPGDEHLVGAGLRVGGITVDFALASGGYLVESNQGLAAETPAWGGETTIQGYRGSAAAAHYSRVVAAQMYGEHRPYGYCSGGSGGGYKTVSCLENSDAWDGGVPFILPHPTTFPNTLSADAHALRLVRDKLPLIVDALEPGGSGNMFEGLNTWQREALASLVRLGFPPRALFDTEAAFHAASWASLADRLIEVDPQYFEDFWTLPGYLGADFPEGLGPTRIQQKTTVKTVVNAQDVAVLGEVPWVVARHAGPGDPIGLAINNLQGNPNLQGATVTVTSGQASGRVLYIVDFMDDVVFVMGAFMGADSLKEMSAGDEVLIDNSNHLAYQTYYRHQVDRSFPEYDQLCSSGVPVYPQRNLLGPYFVRGQAGSNFSGRFGGRMIVVQNLMDEGAWPNHAVYYRGLVEAALGSRLEDRYRLWFNDHANHTGLPLGPDRTRPAKSTRLVDYSGSVQQALRDLSAWVEQGKEPPASTTFELVDGQVRVPLSALERKGIQPVVSVCVNGGARADVAAGETVSFDGIAELVPGAGTIVAAEWDFEGVGDYPLTSKEIDGSRQRVVVKASHAFAEPGTYFPALRVTSQRQGDLTTPYGRVQNLGRVRVVVR